MHPDTTTYQKKLLERTASEPPIKVSWVSEPHSNSSMIKKGTYSPRTASKDKVESLLLGTFGGRFQSFGGGKFTYIAYTD